MRWFIRSALAVVAIVLLAPPTAEAQRRERNRISQEEIAAEKSQSTTYDIVRTLRPQWFRESAARQMSGMGAAAAPATIILYIDGVKMDNVQLLNSIPPARVKEVRYLSPRDAHQRFGMGHEAGVIELTTLKIESSG